MKILVASGSGIYDESYPETERKNTGFNQMIRAYADMFTLFGDEVDIITQSVITEGRKIGKSNLIKKKYSDIVSVSPFYIKRALKIIKTSKFDFSTKLKILLYFSTGAYCEKLIKKNKYDVVHINSMGVSSLPYIYACTRTKTPFVITLHGLKSFDGTVKSLDITKELEKSLFESQKINENILTTVISSGIKRRILNLLNIEELSNINVICNPFIPPETEEKIELPDGFNIVCIGNVCERKNQKLAVEGMRKLDKSIAKNCRLYIIGGLEENLKKYAESIKADNVIFTGSISRNTVNAYLDKADLCLMTTLDEGFGLSIVEGYAHGVPAILPDSVDAFADLYSEETMIPLKEYTPECVANTIKQAYEKNWDKEKIIKKADEFSFAGCTENYLSVFRKSCNSPAVSVKEIDDMLYKALKKEGAV